MDFVWFGWRGIGGTWYSTRGRIEILGESKEKLNVGFGIDA